MDFRGSQTQSALFRLRNALDPLHPCYGRKGGHVHDHSKSVQSTRRLIDAHKAGSSLLSLGVPQCVLSFRDRAEAVRSCLSEQNIPGVRKDTEYMLSWLIRSQLIVNLRTNGISRLRVPNDAKVAHLVGQFPDAKSWTER